MDRITCYSYAFIHQQITMIRIIFIALALFICTKNNGIVSECCDENNFERRNIKQLHTQQKQVKAIVCAVALVFLWRWCVCVCVSFCSFAFFRIKDRNMHCMYDRGTRIETEPTQENINFIQMR